MDVLLRRLLRAALRRGMADQNWTWFVIAGCALVLRRGMGDRGALVSSLKISPGEQVLITVRDRTTPAGEPAGAAVPAADED